MDWKPARERRANVAIADTTDPLCHSDLLPFMREQLEALHRLFGQKSQPHSSIAFDSGNSPAKVIIQWPFYPSMFPRTLGSLTPGCPII